MSTKAAHSPLPWVYDNTPGSGRIIKAILGPDENKRNFAEYVLRGDVPQAIFTDVWTQFPSQEFSDMQDANAELIVTAVNHHQELRTRLDNITNTIELILGNTSGECPQGVNVRNFNALKLAYTEARELLKQLEK
jgi:hypothetical protein